MFMHDAALAPPVNGIVEIAGPDRLRLSDLVQQYLRIKRDPRTVIADHEARYFGARLDDATLVPSAGARIGPSRILAWLDRQAPA